MIRMIQPTEPILRQGRRVLGWGRFLALVLTLAFAALLGRVVQIQQRPDESIVQQMSHRGSTGQLPSRRGALVDRVGRPVALTHTGYRLFVDPSLVDNPLHFATELAYRLGEDAAEYDRAFSSGFQRRYVVLDPLLTPEQVQKVREMKHPALGLEMRSVRTYPNGHRAGQVIGFVGRDHKGLDGLERALNDQLVGRTGHVQVLRDVRRRAIWVDAESFESPRDGQDV